MSHDDDYSDLLSADERTEIERERMKTWASTPADIPEELTRQEYTHTLDGLRNVLIDAEVTPGADGATVGPSLLNAIRDGMDRLWETDRATPGFTMAPISAARDLSPEDIVKAEQAFNNVLAGNDALRVLSTVTDARDVTAIPHITQERLTSLVSVARNLDELTALIRQIVREEIARHEHEQYGRVKLVPTHGFWEGPIFHADGDTSDPKSRRKTGE